MKGRLQNNQLQNHKNATDRNSESYQWVSNIRFSDLADPNPLV